MTENQHLEFKQKVTPGLEKEVVAFLNSKEGGVIYFGVDKNGVSLGMENLDQEQLAIKDRLKNNILPSCMGLFDLVTEKKDEKDVIKLIVAGGYEKPYYIKKYGLSEKGAFIRVGSAAEPMQTRQIEQLYSKRTRNSIGKIKSPKQTLQFQQLHIYYQSLGKNLNEQFARNLELLTEDGDYNYVAYLMNDINNISVQVARYEGLNRVYLKERNEYGYESLIKAVNQVLDKLNLENRTLTEITYKERKEERPWNAVALREAVINSFVHNDYSNETAPKFEIFDDRLEITSHGGLPVSLRKEEFFEGFTIPRNKELMRIFKDLDLVEQLGSGIPRILEAYPKESFHFSDNFLRIVFPTTISSTEQDTEQDTEQVTEQVKLSRLQKEFGSLPYRLDIESIKNKAFIQDNFSDYLSYLDSVFGITSDKLRESFGITSGKDLSNVAMTLFLIGMDSKITAQEIGKILGVSSRTSENYFQKLREAKLIKREGGRKEGYWQLLKQ